MKGKKISYSHMQEAIAKAEAIRAYDERVNRGINELESISQEDEISVSRALEIAEELGITKDYMRKGLERSDLSYESQLEDVRRVNARPSIDLAVTSYNERILRSLSKSFPELGFSSEIKRKNKIFNNGEIYLKFNQEDGSRTSFGLKKKKALALFVFDGLFVGPEFRLKIDIYDSIFLRACREEINNLSTDFGGSIWKTDVVQHYINPGNR